MNKPKPSEINDCQRAYIHCALWSSSDTDKESGAEIQLDTLGREAMHVSAQTQMLKDASDFLHKHYDLFQQAQQALKGYDAEQFGHDFWLTRCGHGTGFWDRGIGAAGEALSKACGTGTAYPSQDLYIGDDDMIYIA